MNKKGQCEIIFTFLFIFILIMGYAIHEEHFNKEKKEHFVSYERIGTTPNGYIIYELLTSAHCSDFLPYTFLSAYVCYHVYCEIHDFNTCCSIPFHISREINREYCNFKQGDIIYVYRPW